MLKMLRCEWDNSANSIVKVVYDSAVFVTLFSWKRSFYYEHVYTTFKFHFTYFYALQASHHITSYRLAKKDMKTKQCCMKPIKQCSVQKVCVISQTNN